MMKTPAEDDSSYEKLYRVHFNTSEPVSLARACFMPFIKFHTKREIVFTSNELYSVDQLALTLHPDGASAEINEPSGKTEVKELE